MPSYKLILAKNAFIFNESYFLQQLGTVMGTRMALLYANLFMGKYEWEFLWNQTVLALVWWRFIENFFAIWTRGEPALQKFVWGLNQHHTSIKFTVNWSTEKFTFIDTRIHLKHQRLETDLYTKPIDKHQYPHMKRCHSVHCKSTIPYSQALRFKRLCFEREHLLEQT